MITKNKLSGRPNAKLTKQFNTVELGHNGESRHATTNKKRTKKSKKFGILLLLILIVVAGATFGLAIVVRNSVNHDDPAGEIPPIDDGAKVEDSQAEADQTEDSQTESISSTEEALAEDELSYQPITNAASSNPTIKYGRLMLINPNFMVDDNFIAARKSELISLNSTYGILELHSYNGDNLIDKEAGAQLARMLADYTAAYPGHTIQTVSCFRQVGTSCGRLCMPTGASDHHTGLTCDLIDPAYGDSLDTDTLDQHIEWQWLKANSYKYGFIDRFPEAWAGGPMSEPMNLNSEGSTGLYETWHYRYVGAYAATQIATGVYNNGNYDSLEHYLKARGLITDLLNEN